jgi:hypothetical protein
MTTESVKHAAEVGGSILGHAAAILIGFIMMVVGLALGVTMVLLPIGLVVGLLGVVIFVWGLLGWREKGTA